VVTAGAVQAGAVTVMLGWDLSAVRVPLVPSLLDVVN
jgi:hypothetical protein